MQIVKEKMKDMVSKTKEKVAVQNAKSDEKAEKSAAGLREEKEIAHELSKARQAEAKMEYHIERAGHRAETLAHRAAGTNTVPPNAAFTDIVGAGGGAVYNAHGQAFGGAPAPPDGAVYPQRPGLGDGASAYGAGVGQNDSYYV